MMPRRPISILYKKTEVAHAYRDSSKTGKDNFEYSCTFGFVGINPFRFLKEAGCIILINKD